jgi:hypothetical protein
MTGRPRGPGRRWSVALWATPSERAEVERRAAEAGLPVARYLLTRALEPRMLITEVRDASWLRESMAAYKQE